MTKILECSSRGDKRFSALYAKVKVFDVWDSIEAHYQNSKEFRDEGGFIKAKSWKEAKEWQKAGKKPVRVNIRGTVLPIDFLSQYYKLLWVKYLDAHPELVEYAKQFDEFTDMFRGKNTLNCQADIIRQYVKEGRASVIKDCQPIIQALKGVFVQETIGDLLEAKEHIIGHQVNCLGVMGAGLARQIKSRYPSVFAEYQKLCHSLKHGRELMGQCQLVVAEEGKRIVANLFGQYHIGTHQQQTEYPFLRQALEVLKRTAMEHGYSVALPYQLGCGLAGGSWDVVRSMISEVFCDYPVTIYRLPNI